MDNKAVVAFKIEKQDRMIDLEIPLDITTRELIIGLNFAYKLGIDASNVKECYLKAENPTVLLRGNKLLSEYGIRNGSVISYSK